MIILALALLGLCLGSFVNALVWRLHEQEKKPAKGLSILKGRSMCPQCRHGLAAKDLIPVLSWLSLRGRCRYCGKPISPQYPLVELGAALAFMASYVWWPMDLGGWETVVFSLWLVLLTGLLALLVYDLRWYLLPNRLIYPLAGIATGLAVARIAGADRPAREFLATLLAVAAGGGVFYVLFQASKGKWIGGGDVKLGWLLGLAVGTPAKALLMIFAASVLGTLVSLPLMASSRLKRTSIIPFGPFLIIGAVLVQLFGSDVLNWYRDTFITF